jgi:hypothetical protein
MAIILKWSKKDSDAVLESYEVYRSTVKATVFNAGNLLATLTDKNQIQYTDDAALSDVPYWYGVRSKTIYGNVDSTPTLLVECSNPGPGLVAPVIGDYADGFVYSNFKDQSFTGAAQKIIMDQLLKTWTESAADFGLYPAHTANTDNTVGGYCINKFWKDGKLIFAPNLSMAGIRNMTAQQSYDTIVKPLMLAKPKVEIDGVLYEFNVMTRAEAMKYNVCGSYKHAAELVNTWTDRVTPKTYSHMLPLGHTARLIHSDLTTGVAGAAGTSPCFTIDTAGTLLDILATSNYGTGGGAAVAWYFTPVNA